VVRRTLEHLVIRVELLSASRHHVAYASLAALTTLPDVVLWVDRAFLLERSPAAVSPSPVSGEPKYREVYAHRLTEVSAEDTT
jgi:hypothetical protein